MAAVLVVGLTKQYLGVSVHSIVLSSMTATWPSDEFPFASPVEGPAEEGLWRDRVSSCMQGFLRWCCRWGCSRPSRATCEYTLVSHSFRALRVYLCGTQSTKDDGFGALNISALRDIHIGAQLDIVLSRPPTPSTATTRACSNEPA